MTHLFKDRVIWALLAALAVLILLELLAFPHAHPAFPWHDLAGYMAIIAVVAALVIGYLTKAWLAPLLQVPEDEDE